MPGKLTDKTSKFQQLVRKAFPFDLTDSQSELLVLFNDFMRSEEIPVFVLRGYAGTGKSTSVSVFSQVLKSMKIQTVLLAPTGRAAKVISNYSRQPAFTIHKKIYRRRLNASGFSEFVLSPNVHANTLFVADEASMIPNDINHKGPMSGSSVLQDLIKYVQQGSNCKLLFVGDTAQLPPVGLEDSPALDESILNRLGCTTLACELTEVTRQADGSGILRNATDIRNAISGNSKNEVTIPKLNTDYPDVNYIPGIELQDALETSFDRYGKRRNIVITRSNKNALLYNQQIRARLFWYESKIVEGELIMIAKNNYFWSDTKEISFIANGDLVEIIRINNYVERYGFTFAEVTLGFIDYPGNPEIETIILLDSLEEIHPAYPGEKLKQLWENVLLDYQDEKNLGKRRKKAMHNPFMNALIVKYAYAVTCHKSQGGQWPVVFIDHGYLTEEMLDNSYLRWLYTAFTRAQEKVNLINFHPLFLQTPP